MTDYDAIPAAVLEWEARPENAGRRWGRTCPPDCDSHDHQPDAMPPKGEPHARHT